MRTQASWSLALMALVMSGALFAGCSSKGKSKPADSGASDGGMDTDGQVEPDGMVPGIPGFDVVPFTGLQTDEDGREATFTVALTAAPTAEVTIALSSDNEGEGRVVSLGRLVFNSVNWAAPQTVTIEGQDDDIADGPVPYTVLLAPAESADDRYEGLDPQDVELVNVDNDSPGATITGADVRTTEGGGEDTFTIRLNSRPTAEVTIALVSSDTDEVTVSPASVVFSADNWSAPQPVTVKGVDDDEADGDVTVTIGTTATSADEGYDDLEVADITVVNTDNDTAGFGVAPVAGLRTNENGRQDSFTVALLTRPTADVVIGVSSSDETEATVATGSLVFTTNNWNAPQAVIVTGVDDADADGSQPFTIVLAAATSADTSYEGLDPTDVAGLNIDNDSVGISLEGAEGLSVSENGGQATFTVVLNHLPTATVTIPVASSDVAEATVAPANLVFTTSNWNAPQTVTITGVDDDEADGSQEVTIDLGDPMSDDQRYADLTGPNVLVTVTDDESAGITVNKAEPFETNESGGQTTFSIVLNSQPSADVTIPVASSDTGEITVSAASVTFTTANWNAPQTVTLTGVDDDIADGNQPVTIVIGAATSGDAGYQGLDPQDLLASNVDNDSAGVTVAPRVGLETSESGAQASFTVRLNSRPADDVSFTMSVSDVSEGALSAGSLTFTSDNWNAPQTVTLTGVNDDVADGPQAYAVVFGAGVSGDARYSGLVLPNLTVINNDDDTAGVELLDAETLVTTEAPGGEATFRVRLRSQPTADVTVNISSSNVSEGTVLPTTLTFTSVNWNAGRTVTVTGVDDEVQDGAQVYQVRFAVVSGDSRYNGISVGNVAVTNTDNDTAGVTVAAATLPLTVSEAGTQTTFTVRLNSRPVSPVTIPIVVSDSSEATVSPASVSFNGDDWSGVKTVTITGLGDLIQDGNQEFQVNFGPIMGGATYSAITVPSLTVTNFDTDSPGINVVVPAPLVSREDGTQTSFRVSLGRRPSGNVSLPIFVIEGDEAQVVSAPVVFTPDNYAAEVTVVIQGVNDDIADGPQPFRVRIGPAESVDVSYAGRTVPTLNGTNIDNDSPGVIVTPTTPRTVAEGGGTDGFFVSLTSEPIGTVSIPVASLNPGQVSTNVATLTFTAADWDSAKAVTITAVDDLVADGNQPFSVALGPTQASASDANYQAITIPNVTGVATDNDVAGLEVQPSSVDPAPQLETGEDGTADTFRVRLTSQPTTAVTINVASTQTGEGVVVPASVVVQPADYASWQTFTVTGVNDDVADGTVSYFITIASDSADPNYVRSVPNLTVRNIDNDQPGISVSTGALPPTTESGLPQQTFSVKLDSQPVAPVRIDLASSDLSEVTISTNSLLFTAANWNVAQTVTVTGVDDFVADGDQAVRVDIAPAVSADLLYNGRTVTNLANTYVTITNNDDDTASIAVPDDQAEIYDQPSSDTFTVVLTSQPLVNVIIPLTVGDASEATIDKSALTFTPSNWNVPQTVTVNSVEDAVRDGDQVFMVFTGNALAVGDSNYDGMNGPDILVMSRDAGTSCLSIKLAGPLLPSGMYVLDPDLTGPIARFPAYCDMATVRDGQAGGWTLLSWSVDTTLAGGTPYPGLAQCGANNFQDCSRGTGVPTAALDALFDESSELAQGQTITETAVAALTTGFVDLGTYEFAGSFVYASLEDLSIATGTATCSLLETGTYDVITGADPSIDGVEVYLTQSLAGGADPTFLNFGSDSNAYRYSLGNSTGACLLNGTPPASFLGTWQGAQYGPEQQNAAGAYSVWVR